MVREAGAAFSIFLGALDRSDYHLAQQNDFNVKEYHETSSFLQIWLDSPGDRPKDIRARRFVGEINPLCHLQVRHHLTSLRMPVYRATFTCAEACCRDMQSERQDEETERQRDSPSMTESEEDDSDMSDEEPAAPKLPRKRTTNETRTCKVILHVSLPPQFSAHSLTDIFAKGGDNSRQT